VDKKVVMGKYLVIANRPFVEFILSKAKDLAGSGAAIWPPAVVISVSKCG